MEPRTWCFLGGLQNHWAKSHATHNSIFLYFPFSSLLFSSLSISVPHSPLSLSLSLSHSLSSFSLCSPHSSVMGDESGGSLSSKAGRRTTELSPQPIVILILFWLLVLLTISSTLKPSKHFYLTFKKWKTHTLHSVYAWETITGKKTAGGIVSLPTENLVGAFCRIPRYEVISGTPKWEGCCSNNECSAWVLKRNRELSAWIWRRKMDKG